MADTNITEAQGLHDLCLSAFTAEYKNDHVSAASLHKSSIEHLAQALKKTGLLEHNQKRALRRKIKIHEGRLRNRNVQHAAPFVLVIPQNRQDIIEEQFQQGTAKIGLVSRAQIENQNKSYINPKELRTNFMITGGYSARKAQA